jgi:hypothetical protein
MMFGLGKKKRTSNTTTKRCTYGNKRGRCIKSSGHSGSHYGANGSVLVNAERNGY